MKISIFGLTISSSWGNGHATPYRAILRALHRRGHRVTFFEKDVPYYAARRDFAGCDFCDLVFYQEWEGIRRRALREAADSDVVIVASYCPQGAQISDDVLALPGPLRVFYDLDTPITLQNLERGDVDYLRAEQISQFDLYLSFTGGAILDVLLRRWKAQQVGALFGCVDPNVHRRVAPRPDLACVLSYMGTYAPDRQKKLEELLCTPARHLGQRKFIVAGPQYPKSLAWPANVKRIVHVEPRFHPPFYCSSRMTLNVTREHMVNAGYSPSVRLFEAAGCGTTILSDSWPGLSAFFEPGKEILLPATWEDVVRYVDAGGDAETRHIGQAAQERVMSEHTAEQRARQFEKYVSCACRTVAAE